MSSCIQTTDPSVRIACAICNSGSQHTDWWAEIHPVTGERSAPTKTPGKSHPWGTVLEQSTMHHYPTLSCYMHLSCYNRFMRFIAQSMSEEIASVLHDRINNGSSKVVCTLCGGFNHFAYYVCNEEVHHFMRDYLWCRVHQQQRSMIYNHPILGVVHSTCVNRVIMRNPKLGLDNPVLWAKLNMVLVSQYDYLCQADMIHNRKIHTGGGAT